MDVNRLPRRAMEERTCARPACGQVFVVNGKHHRQQFCSKACASAVRMADRPAHLRRMCERSAARRQAQAIERVRTFVANEPLETAGRVIYDRGWHAGYNSGRQTEARVVAELRKQVADLRARLKRATTTASPLTSSERAELSAALEGLVS